MSRRAQITLSEAEQRELLEAEAEVHRDPGEVFELAKELTARYAQATAEGEAAEALRAQARKRVAIRFRARRVASWDHRKLG